MKYVNKKILFLALASTPLVHASKTAYKAPTTQQLPEAERLATEKRRALEAQMKVEATARIARGETITLSEEKRQALEARIKAEIAAEKAKLQYQQRTATTKPITPTTQKKSSLKKSSATTKKKKTVTFAEQHTEGFYSREEPTAPITTEQQEARFGQKGTPKLIHPVEEKPAEEM